MSAPLLSIEDLSIQFTTPRGPVLAVSNVSLTVLPGEKLAIVGESGSGKTTTVMAALSLLPKNATVAAGKILLDGRNVATATNTEMRRLRGRFASVVFQNARAALNPVRCIGDQIIDTILAHTRVSRRTAKARALELLGDVRFPSPERQFSAYPHQLSGGMCQRAMLALAIACEPKLLIADEPTTGLDVTTQKTIMALIDDIVQARNMSLILITHDLALAGAYTDRVIVMRNGAIVEQGPTIDVLTAPRTDYARTLVEATPRLSGGKPNTATRKPLLAVSGLTRTFAGHKAVNDVSFTVGQNECVGLVGESGSGKSTIARLVSRLLDPDSGSIGFNGEKISGIAKQDFYRSPIRSKIQLVFQDPTDSLAPHRTVFASIADPLRRLTGLRGAELRTRVETLADQVQIDRSLLDRLPHQLSGGQKARVGIARAIAVEPELLVLDEPTASLDVSVQAVILELLGELRRQLGMSYLFISHDLNVVSNFCDRTIVLQNGAIIEAGDSSRIFTSPAHSYTRQLLDAALQLPTPDRVPLLSLAK